MKRMKKGIKDLWVAALRSGEFRQGQSALRKADDTFCCLGVLCELARRNEVPMTLELHGDVYRYNGVSLYTPDPVIEWAGLSAYNPRIEVQDRPDICHLASANDQGVSFDQIADIIEEQL